MILIIMKLMIRNDNDDDNIDINDVMIIINDMIVMIMNKW